MRPHQRRHDRHPLPGQDLSRQPLGRPLVVGNAHDLAGFDERAGRILETDRETRLDRGTNHSHSWRRLFFAARQKGPVIHILVGGLVAEFHIADIFRYGAIKVDDTPDFLTHPGGLGGPYRLVPG